MGRRASREIAMKLIYQLEIQKDSREEQINNTLEQYDLNENDREYILDVVKGVFKNQWKLSRISKVDLAILRLAIYEMCHRDDIPFTVAINEAVELAKNYSGEESGSFINGILGKVKLMSADGNENRDEE